MASAWLASTRAVFVMTTVHIVNVCVTVVCANRLVECTYCGRKQHQICALHMEQIWPNDFVCAGCVTQHAYKRRDNKYTAKREWDASSTFLSDVPPTWPCNNRLVFISSSAAYALHNGAAVVCHLFICVFQNSINCFLFGWLILPTFFFSSFFLF